LINKPKAFRGITTEDFSGSRFRRPTEDIISTRKQKLRTYKNVLTILKSEQGIWK